MKTYVKIAVLFIVAALIVFAVYALQRASLPESAIIAHERDAIYASRDKIRMEKDVTYAVDMRDRMQFLDLRTAAAHIAENNPDAAIAVIRKLIAEEEAHAASGVARRSRSYVSEMHFYETLASAYELKKDDDGAKKAMATHDTFLQQAAEAKKRENTEEGKHVGLAGD